MYTETDIINLIDRAREVRSETSSIEFKDARGGFPANTWSAISAFSHNPNGGVIVFGIEENESSREIQIVGGLDIATLQEQTSGYIRDAMVNAGNHRISIFEEDEMKTFIRNNRIFKFDKTEAVGIDLTQLSEEKLSEFLKKSSQRTNRTLTDNEPTPPILKNLGLADDFANGIKPTVAGFLIFSKYPPQQLKQFSRYIIQCVRYKGVTMASDIIDKQDLVGTVDNHIE